MGEHHRRISVPVWLAALAVMIISLLPWWRNHDYLRDFYDYGLVIAGLGLLEQGQRPYVDFTTPIQAGFFGMSWLVEKIGGGTFLGLTRGGAALIILMATGLTSILSRRWPWWAAAAVALTVTVASASQHTILWHNTLGVFCLALVVWASALAPVWQRQDWPWHALVAAGLLMGGLNKMNFHLVALAAALAWALRAGFCRQAVWGRVVATGVGWLVVGGALPLALELGWTGASLEIWRHNVIGLAAASRADVLPEIFRWKFLTTPIHDYYGPLKLPQVGWAGVAFLLGAMMGCWPRGGAGQTWNRDWLFLPVATLLVGAAGAALLATNQEIAYVGLAAWLVLVAGLWLGFAPDLRRRRFFAGALVLPALMVGGIAWASAWQGQRSQFGYSPAARSSYELADDAGATFAYLHGLWLPPESMLTLTLLEKWLPAATVDGRRPVFYGAGTEWVQRFLPGVRQPGQPLWVHWGTTYGSKEVWHLVQWLATDLRYEVVLSLLARDHWLPEVQPTLDRFFQKDLLGPVTSRWTRINHITEYVSDSINFNNLAGGNVAGLILRTEESPFVVSLPFEGDRIMLGVMGGEGLLLMGEPTYRFGAEAVLERNPRAGNGAMFADFRVIVHGAMPEVMRWSSRVELPAGETRVAVPFMVDAMGRNLRLMVSVPDAAVGRLSAGYRNLKINHAMESAAGAPRLRPGVAADVPVTPEFAECLLAGVTWRPQELVARGVRPGRMGLELVPGGELWMHTPEMTGEIRGQLSRTATAGAAPMVRIVWYKGGRLQIMQQGQIPADRPFDFHVWTAEPGGWIGIMVDPMPVGAPVQVRVSDCTLVP